MLVLIGFDIICAGICLTPCLVVDDHWEAFKAGISVLFFIIMVSLGSYLIVGGK